MNDNDIYEMYKNYRIMDVMWLDDFWGYVYLNFPPPDCREYVIDFHINDNNTIVLSRPLPEFVLKDVVNRIRTMRDENNQYLWGV